MELNTLLPMDAQSTATTLTFVQREQFPTKFIQDYTNTSVFDGASALGGLWTFVNGAFVLFFGANVMYFAFGKRTTTPDLVHGLN